MLDSVEETVQAVNDVCEMRKAEGVAPSLMYRAPARDSDEQRENVVFVMEMMPADSCMISITPEPSVRVMLLKEDCSEIETMLASLAERRASERVRSEKETEERLYPRAKNFYRNYIRFSSARVYTVGQPWET